MTKQAIVGTMSAMGTAISGAVAQVDVAFPAWLQYGALGLCGICVVGLFWTIFRLIQGYNDVCDRWDKWEQQRHTDSAAISETLTRLRESCAAVRREP